MTLVIVHYHLRPGGIRRIIELATPYLVRANRSLQRVVLATGQRTDRSWHAQFAEQLAGTRLEVFVDPSFHYLSEQRGSPARITARLRSALANLFGDLADGHGLVWAHNLGVGRNLLLARELAAVCARRRLPLVSHHHDWWFDNRWVRWREMQSFGFHRLDAPARVIFPRQRHLLHVAINHTDAAVLGRHLPGRSLWLPNLTEPAPPPPARRIRATRSWLERQLGRSSAPVWLLPCRTLRRKNLAEALLLTRWLRPEAWLVVTGGASSADEQPYFDALAAAAHQHHWRLRLGVLAGDETRKPSVRELLAASEAVLLTSIQEGFGLPYLEAAAAGKPLLARQLPNIAPDLWRFGFRFPQAYDEILVPPGLFDWPAERRRQRTRYAALRSMMPARARSRLSLPALLAAEHRQAVPFSRLTLAAQLEILARPPQETWAACAPLNPFLATWQRRAESKTLRRTPWPRSAHRWLGGDAYARRLLAALAAQSAAPTAPVSPALLQSDFINRKLATHNLYPLLWHKHA